MRTFTDAEWADFKTAMLDLAIAVDNLTEATSRVANGAPLDAYELAKLSHVAIRRRGRVIKALRAHIDPSPIVLDPEHSAAH